ncbi:outer membrane protein [Flavivirga spongiicola]|uniref:Outer membrane protein beta-barrel domain-containing protein n=1 Tax=Flavivirga spongiicola TaxID=421621 RepID=A0ABU7XWC7_9FLAO|nr:hypothetical protein [Flavivirga sp. MEBiC05379]MDO5979246.1 hypothetical protein [Flavivirga sp. MEBiC05379]
MKKIYFFTVLFTLLINSNLSAQGMTEAGSLGVGAQFNSLFYGLSAKYNFTEIHSGEIVVGGGNYGFGGDFSSFTVTGRYLYNFDIGNENLRPYVFGQVGFWTLKFDGFNILGVSTPEVKETSISYGFGGGAEYAFSGLEQLGFNIEIGYGGGSFGNGLGYSGMIFGAGFHYYFNL